MQAIIKSRWLIILLWAAAVAALVFTAPNMEQLVREKGQITIPDGYSSSIAADIQQRHTAERKDGVSFVLVFHNPEGLKDADYAEIARAVQILKQGKESLGVTSVTSVIESKELESQLVAKDKTTTLALVEAESLGRDFAGIREDLSEAIRDIPVEHYYTGSMMIDEDVVISSQKGLKRTEIITVVFILAVLVLVFRSVAAPVIPLLTVGIAYIASQSVVAFLVDAWDFPLSTFTQIFLVAVLFGIGTDYCILLLSRFKEELASNSQDVKGAIIRTYATAGRTVFFSALAALVGFASIGFASFKLYQSAAAVAIGVAALLLALFTIVPFFMALLGPKLFWPTKGALEHKESKLWESAGRFSLRRPYAAVLFVGIIIVPLLIAYRGNLSFNSLNEIGDSYESVKGFNIIEQSFSPGEAMPATVVLESEVPLDTNEAYAMIEKVSREVAKTPGVEKVRSLTRPLGEEMNEFTVPYQVKALSDGLGQGTDGLAQIRDGLAEAGTQLQASAPELQKAAAGVDELIAGTVQLKEGVLELQNGLTQLEQGVRSGAAGAAGLAEGLAQIRASTGTLAESNMQLLEGYRTLESGLKRLTGYYATIESGLADSAAALTSLDARFASLAGKYPDLLQDEDFLTIRGTVSQTGLGLEDLEAGLKMLDTELSRAMNGLVQANGGFAQAAAGQQAVADALGQLEAGAAGLQSGLTQAADGQKQAAANLPAMSEGLGQIAEGQTGLKEGFLFMGSQLSQLTDGLNQSVSGLNELAGGLTGAQDYLNELSRAPDKETAGWFLPQQAAQDAQFQQVLATYLSEDRKAATFDVVLSNNPYSTEALDSIADIEDAVRRGLAGTAWEKAELGIGGVSGTYADLQSISDADYKRTVMLMLAGISLILIILLRSIVMPLYLIAALLLSYFSSLAVNELIFVKLLGFAGTNWTIPFFGFVILMALGVDYSIFLMDRFNEHKDEPVESAILTAMKNMGTVIVSAVIILAGTFAAMFPSGVLSLLQIATVVLSGLLLYALLFLPFFVPVMVRLFGRANWWPFTGKSRGADKDHSLHI